MRIVPIFANCLYAIKYDTEEVNEFDRLFDQWQDIEYLKNFFETHEQDLQNGFYGTLSVKDAVRTTRNEAGELQKGFKRMAQQAVAEQSSGLDGLFKPLDNNQYKIVELIKSKAKGNSSRSWLRIYAVRVDSNLYIVTGGAIKLTATMQERAHTRRELQKIDKCRDYLREQSLIDEVSFREFEI